MVYEYHSYSWEHFGIQTGGVTSLPAEGYLISWAVAVTQRTKKIKRNSQKHFTVWGLEISFFFPLPFAHGMVERSENKKGKVRGHLSL